MKKKCPNCGACPECGARPPYVVQPYGQPYPYPRPAPYWYGSYPPVWVGGGTPPQTIYSPNQSGVSAQFQGGTVTMNAVAH